MYLAATAKECNVPASVDIPSSRSLAVKARLWAAPGNATTGYVGMAIL